MTKLRKNTSIIIKSIETMLQFYTRLKSKQDNKLL